MSAETGAAAATAQATEAVETAQDATAAAAQQTTGEESDRWAKMENSLGTIAETLTRLESRLPQPSQSSQEPSSSPRHSAAHEPAAAKSQNAKQPQPQPTLQVQAQPLAPKAKSRKDAGSKRFGFRRKPSQP